MLIFFIYLLIISAAILGYGLLAKFYFYKKGIITSLNLGETLIVGFFLFYLISVSFHFFIPLNEIFNSFIIITGISLLLIFKKIIKIEINTIIFFVLFILILPGLFTLKNHPDFDWYYLPYINYLNQFKIIF